jgi:hypothetical protein
MSTFDDQQRPRVTLTLFYKSMKISMDVSDMWTLYTNVHIYFALMSSTYSYHVKKFLLRHNFVTKIQILLYSKLLIDFCTSITKRMLMMMDHRLLSIWWKCRCHWKNDSILMKLWNLRMRTTMQRKLRSVAK